MSPKRSAGEGTFKKRPSGLIEHSISFGRDQRGKQIRPTVYGRTKIECRNKMAHIIEDMRRSGGLRLPDDTPLGTWLAAWLVRKKSEVAESTYLAYENSVKKHIDPHLGRIRLDRLRVRDVDEWLTALVLASPKPVGGRARQYARMVLGNAVNDAMRLEMIDRNVVTLTRSPKHEAREFPVWDVIQALAFLDAAKECRFYAFWVLWLTTGPRPHELLGIRREDVDLKRGAITLTKQASRRRAVREQMKTESSRRPLSLAPIAVEALRAHLAIGGNQPWLFPSKNKVPMNYRMLIEDHYDAIVERARYLEDGKEKTLPRIRPYDLRHTYATLALKAGIPIPTVSESLGHASPVTTMRVYAHVVTSMRTEHVDRIQELFGPPDPTAIRTASDPESTPQGDCAELNLSTNGDPSSPPV